MKKSTLIIIFTVYLASILVVSMLGMRAKVFDPVVLAQSVQLSNETNEDYRVVDTQDGKRIEINFTTSGHIDENGAIKGTYIQLSWRVLPDNASNKKIRINYNNSLQSVESIKDSNGNDLGLLLIKSKAFFTVTLSTVDGSGKKTVFTIWAK